MSIKTRATIEDLYKVEGKAELVHGEIVYMSPTGGRPGRASLEIAMSLRLYEREHGSGYAFPNNVAVAVNLPHRESFGPDGGWPSIIFSHNGEPVDNPTARSSQANLHALWLMECS